MPFHCILRHLQRVKFLKKLITVGKHAEWYSKEKLYSYTALNYKPSSKLVLKRYMLYFYSQKVDSV